MIFLKIIFVYKMRSFLCRKQTINRLKLRLKQKTIIFALSNIHYHGKKQKH
jgi:hypothetical protein